VSASRPGLKPRVYTTELNEKFLACGHLGVRLFIALDHQTYEPGALDTKTKELLGLVASTVQGFAFGCHPERSEGSVFREEPGRKQIPRAKTALGMTS